MSPVVLDCSAVLSWFLPDEIDDAARRVQDVVVSDGAVVPTVWRMEVANGLMRSERNKRISRTAVDLVVDLLPSLSIVVDDDDVGLDRLIAASRDYGLTAYDGAYLELAIRRRLRLATRDTRLAIRARREGITVI
jgi:predicted nucleic acid-binding protein